MPIENERKFVLDDDGTLERSLAAAFDNCARLAAGTTLLNQVV